MKAKHPMQPIVWATDGCIRFKQNKIIDYLFTSGKMNLNAIACMDFPNEDRVQLAQLLGYSVSGFGDLSYIPKKLVRECDAIAEAMSKKRRRKRPGSADGVRDV